MLLGKLGERGVDQRLARQAAIALAAHKRAQIFEVALEVGNVSYRRHSTMSGYEKGVAGVCRVLHLGDRVDPLGNVAVNGDEIQSLPNGRAVVRPGAP